MELSIKDFHNEEEEFEYIGQYLIDTEKGCENILPIPSSLDYSPLGFTELSKLGLKAINFQDSFMVSCRNELSLLFSVSSRIRAIGKLIYYSKESEDVSRFCLPQMDTNLKIVQEHFFEIAFY